MSGERAAWRLSLAEQRRYARDHLRDLDQEARRSLAEAIARRPSSARQEVRDLFDVALRRVIESSWYEVYATARLPAEALDDIERALSELIYHDPMHWEQRIEEEVRFQRAASQAAVAAGLKRVSREWVESFRRTWEAGEQHR